MQHISCMIWKEWHAIVAVGHKQYHAIATVQNDHNELLTSVVGSMGGAVDGMDNDDNIIGHKQYCGWHTVQDDDN